MADESGPLTDCFGHLDVDDPDDSVDVEVVTEFDHGDGENPAAELRLQFSRGEVVLALDAADVRALIERLLAALDE